jgi:hypothetical protein
LSGHDPRRHPQHYTVWTATLAVLAGFSAVLIFGTRSHWWHVLGWAGAVLDGYIILAFFLPLWLPPIRERERHSERRNAAWGRIHKRLDEIHHEMDDAS